MPKRKRPAQRQIPVTRRGQLKLTDVGKVTKYSLFDKPRGRGSSIGSDDTIVGLESDISESGPEYVGTATPRKKRRPCMHIVPVGSTEQPSVTIRGMLISRDTIVEFRDRTFMRVQQIHKEEQLILIGHIFTRLDIVGPRPPQTRNGIVWESDEHSHKPQTRIPTTHRGKPLLNEVAWNIAYHHGEDKQYQSLWRRPLTDVIRKHKMIFTNHSYESLCQTEVSIDVEADDFKEKLICRWKNVQKFDEYGHLQEESWEALTTQEADVGFTQNAQVQLSIFRQQNDIQHDYDSDLEMGTSSTSLKKIYTFCDAFCGAGGVSSGAKAAGLNLRLAFDKDKLKISTYRANFPACNAMNITVDQFIQWARHWRVDVLHLSCPCQAYSPANTRPNEHLNDQNQPPTLACGELVKALRPRIVTVEQTRGLESRHSEWFDALVLQFTELQFSVKWTTLNCADFGVPQHRKRLILFAAAPGQTLPNFPKPTHSIQRRTIADALDEVAAYPYKDPAGVIDRQSPLNPPRASYDPRTTLANTITCNGGVTFHPSGLRHFTIREFLALQGFSIDFKLGYKEDRETLGLTEMRKQIGNAVPPRFAKLLFGSVLEALRKTDE